MGESDLAAHPATFENGLSLYSRAFDTLPLGIVFQDAHGVITQANPAAQRILGLGFDQMRGLTSVDPRWQTIHEDGSPFPGDMHPAMVALRTGKPAPDIRMGVHNPQRGDTTWITVKAYPIFEPATGAVQGVYALFDDITHTLQIEREQARLSRARLLAHGCNLALFEAQDKQALLDGFCRFLIEAGGYRMAWIALLEGDSPAPVRCAAHAGQASSYLEDLRLAREFDQRAIGRALDSGTTQITRGNAHPDAMTSATVAPATPGFRSSVVIPLTSLGHIFGTLNVYSGEQNAFTPEEVTLIEEMARSLAFGIDAHRARRRRIAAEAELARHEERLSALISASPVGVFETDTRGLVTYVNARWEQIAGIDAQAAAGKGWATAVHPDDKQRLFAEWMAAIAGAQPLRIGFRFRHADGKVVWVIGQAARLPGSDTQAEGYVGTVTDITDLKIAEAELAKYREHLEALVKQRTAELSVAKEAAEAASEAKTAFLANISHELRTPLHGVIGMTGLAQSRAIDPAQKETLDGVMRAARHLGIIVNDLLDISRIETRRLALADEYFELRDVIDTPTNISRLAASAKGLGFEVDLAPELAARSFRGDTSRLRQVLLNLTSNAVKFTATGGIKVQVSVAEDGDADALLRFDISDTGIGIAAADQSRLFEMFEQVRTAAGGLHHGAGLGLALSRRLAEAMGGSIGLQSLEGKGSTFWFTARVRKERTRAPAQTPAIAAETALQTLKREYAGKRLLLVDDNEDNRALLKAQLRPVWKSVYIAIDGMEAVEMAGKQHYDLILMDMRMPRMDGLEATRRIRQLPGWDEIPIIAMTANVYPEDRARCLAAGMNDFIPKAVSAEAPFEILLKWLAPR